MKMNIQFYINNESLLAGTTFKTTEAFEQNNMALHICEDEEHVVENRKRLAATLQCDLHNFVCANQTHSDHFYKVTKEDMGKGASSAQTAIPNTDALYTYETNILLCTFTADCVPVIFYNEQKGLVGVIHSGWQGTVKEITLKMFSHLEEKELCDPKDFIVFIGTALSQEKFEVDEDVYLKFKALGYADDYMYYNETTNKYHIDNQLTVKKQCELAGIPSENIQIDRTCTFQNPNGFSYRENKKAGRHVSFIMKK